MRLAPRQTRVAAMAGLVTFCFRSSDVAIWLLLHGFITLQRKFSHSVASLGQATCHTVTRPTSQVRWDWILALDYCTRHTWPSERLASWFLLALCNQTCSVNAVFTKCSLPAGGCQSTMRSILEATVLQCCIHVMNWRVLMTGSQNRKPCFTTCHESWLIHDSPLNFDLKWHCNHYYLFWLLAVQVMVTPHLQYVCESKFGDGSWINWHSLCIYAEDCIMVVSLTLDLGLWPNHTPTGCWRFISISCTHWHSKHILLGRGMCAESKVQVNLRTTIMQSSVWLHGSNAYLVNT